MAVENELRKGSDRLIVFSRPLSLIRMDPDVQLVSYGLPRLCRRSLALARLLKLKWAEIQGVCGKQALRAEQTELDSHAAYEVATSAMGQTLP